VIDKFQVRNGADLIKWLSHMVWFEARKEGAIVVNALYESVDGVSIGFHRCNYNLTVLVFECLGFLHSSCSSRYCLLINASSIIYCESNILDSVAVLCVVCRELCVVRIKWRRECIDNIVVAYDMSAEFP